MDLFESIQQQAMLGIVSPDDDAWLRRIFRYYSRNFATPLHVVRTLPLEDVLLAYFEEVFENLDEEQREERIEWLLMSPEQRDQDAEADKTMAARDEEFFNRLNAEVASGETIKRPREQQRQVVDTEAAPLPEGMKALAKKLKRVKERTAKLAGVQLPSPKAKTPAPTLGELPEINVSFSKPGNLQDDPWADVDPLAPPKKKKT